MNRFVWLAAAALVVPVLACDNTARGAKEDARENTAAARDAASPAAAQAADTADHLGDKAKEAGSAVEEAAKNAGEKLKEGAEAVGDKAKEGVQDAKRSNADEKAKGAAHDAGNTIDAAKQTLDVKTALMADKSVDASHIDVDTSGDAHTVTLKGTVPTAAQKDAAKRIAHGKAPGWKIVNQLTVAAR
jgi:osmotically-inducible protein OsmY